MSAGYSLSAVASKLRARVVPAELANATVAACLMEYAKDLMGVDGVAMAAHVVAHGLVVGGELESRRSRATFWRDWRSRGPRCCMR